MRSHVVVLLDSQHHYRSSSDAYSLLANSPIPAPSAAVYIGVHLQFGAYSLLANSPIPAPSAAVYIGVHLQFGFQLVF
jgi:hypothetical protein